MKLHNFSYALIKPLLLSSVLLISGLSLTGTTAAEEFERKDIENIVREYLLSNPEIMLDVQEALDTKQEELRVAQQAETLATKSELIYNSPNQMIIGDVNAKHTIVEFFDYNCGFCKRALSDMNRIVEESPDVKFVLKEFPVLGEPSAEAHRISLAVIKLYPELYADFHQELLSGPGRKDGNRALDLAVSLGADKQKLEEMSKTADIADAFREVYEIADGLGITGTPSYVIGNEVVFGAVGYDRLSPKLDNLRQCGTTIC